MRLTATIIMLGFVAATVGCAGHRSATSTRIPQAPAEDLRFKLATVGDVFVPGCLPRGAESVDVVVHFHGAPQVVEREFTAAGLRAVLVTVNYRGLSSAYEKPFSDPKLFRTVLDETLAELKARELVSQDANWRHVCVSSFSAGFGAVRALLRVSEHFNRIDTLYLADTLYAGYVEDGGRRKVNPENMRDFRRFAAEAAAGRKTMIITHSYLEPGHYAGTHETADDLIAFVDAERRIVDEPGPASMRIISRVDQGNFHVYGCAGTTGEDHMEHLRNMRAWYYVLLLGRAP
ncbi:MAG: hypothetical protein KKI02_09240 [Planctomycetes bacterium]|nr:hypothetical protein [Planctomycetota bacterium]